MNAGCIPLFVRLLGSGRHDLRHAAATGLNNLTSGDGAVEERLAAMAAGGAISALARELEWTVEGPRPSVEAAAALGALCQGSSARVQMTAGARTTQTLQRLLLRADLNLPHDVRGPVYAALAELSGASAREAPQPSSQPAQPRAPRVCAAPSCGATHSLRRCTGCNAVRYYSVEHQHRHWREHRTECRCLQPSSRSGDAP